MECGILVTPPPPVAGGLSDAVYFSAWTGIGEGTSASLGFRAGAERLERHAITFFC